MEVSADPGRVRAVLGLGNPGARYQRTRHNAGYLVVDRLRQAGGEVWRTVGEREECRARLGGRTVVLTRPLTYMNRSGDAAARLWEVEGIPPGETLVVADDVALPWGRLRIRAGGGAGGHRGLESIRDRWGTEEFPRLRVGVGAPVPGGDLAEFVLHPLEGGVWEEFEQVVTRAAEAVRVVCVDGLEAGMNRFNPPPPQEAEESA